MKNKHIADWKQYEWLVTKILHDEYSSPTVTVLGDSRITGEYSERSRQIDILIRNGTVTTIVECKHYNKPVDVKAAEAFMSMMNDVGANFGILISSNGFTSSVSKRIREFGDRIKLESLNWIDAYKTSFVEESYGKMTDICPHCFEPKDKGRAVPGLLCWQHGLGIIQNGKVSIGSVGKCLKCGCHTVYCDSCGWVTVAEHEEPCCELRDIFFEYGAKET
ncbi:restriction endonuclease [Vibrio porteresiae]|uniref:Restriction endonuclease n=1 Tax=Vibrio porteresiae DSM 19223 TaxID=1123496 RepID=A0ABZ0Q9G7_9VIBR|nr:restriction endonuclease [Vibrio porteresiae]WPC72427.1 restriction endonuclease [Vibrio porteresiae DSM 19223]